MNKYIIASCLIAVVFGWTLSQSDNRCTCDQYYNKAECQNECVWSETLSVCIVPPCDQYKVDKACEEESNGYCYWNTNCVPFQNCESIQGNSTEMCYNFHYECTWQSGSNCITNKCSLYNSTNCPPGCYQNGSSCQDYTSCSQYNTSYFCDTGPCHWTYTNNTCNQIRCEDHSKSFCTRVEIMGSDSIIPCFYNGTICTEAQPSDLSNLTMCQTNTYGIYHWSSTNATDGSCIACYGYFVQIIFTLILVIA